MCTKHFVIGLVSQQQIDSVELDPLQKIRVGGVWLLPTLQLYNSVKKCNQLILVDHLDSNCALQLVFNLVMIDLTTTFHNMKLLTDTIQFIKTTGDLHTDTSQKVRPRVLNHQLPQFLLLFQINQSPNFICTSNQSSKPALLVNLVPQSLKLYPSQSTPWSFLPLFQSIQYPSSFSPWSFKSAPLLVNLVTPIAILVNLVPFDFHQSWSHSGQSRMVA